MPENAVVIQKAPKLKPGPLALYILFCASVKERRVLKRNEIFAIYKNKVACGVCSDYRYTGDMNNRQRVYYIRDWSEWEWKNNFEAWFTRTLGALLRKGYLRVVPAIDLSECDLTSLIEKDNICQNVK